MTIKTLWFVKRRKIFFVVPLPVSGGCQFVCGVADEMFGNLDESEEALQTTVSWLGLAVAKIVIKILTYIRRVSARKIIPSLLIQLLVD